jgi:dTDP-glucose pyrophosphorylase
VTQAIVLAAGTGSRLRPFTDTGTFTFTKADVA